MEDDNPKEMVTVLSVIGVVEKRRTRECTIYKHGPSRSKWGGASQSTCLPWEGRQGIRMDWTAVTCPVSSDVTCLDRWPVRATRVGRDGSLQ